MKFENPDKHFTKSEIDAITKALQTARDVSFLETLMHIIPSPIFYKDNDGVYKFCNKAFCDYIGKPKEAIIDHTVYDIAPLNLANIYHHSDLELMDTGGSQIYESQVKYQDDSLHDVMFHKTSHLGADGESIGLVGVMVDITTQKNTQRLIQRQNSVKDILIKMGHIINQQTDRIDFFNLLLDELVISLKHVDYGLIYELTDEDNLKIISNNGHDIDYLLDFIYPLTDSIIYEHAKGRINAPNHIDDLKEFCGDNYPPHLKTLDSRKVQSCIYIPIALENDKRIIIMLESASKSAFSDIDISTSEYIQLQIPILYQIHSLNKKTLQLSRYDTLTGLMNRGYFNTLFEDRLRLAKRDESKLSLVMFDLDGLKIINDNFGHAAGDTYLEQFAEFVKHQFRSTDTFARIGGDEFLGIFSTTDPITLKKKLTLLQTLYTQLPIKAGDTSFNGRFSYGIATYPTDADTADGLMTIADIKMYSDKKNVASD